MADTHNVFISWSGERSRQAAEVLREWLGTVLQNTRPWMSTEIEKGSRSFEEIARALDGMKLGIICLTPENLTSEWLHYEAGALSKTPDAKTRVCTYLLADLEFATLKPPLSWFQWTKAHKTDTRKLIGTINNHPDTTPLPESRLDATFEKWWPDLEQKLAALPAPSGSPPPSRSPDDMIAEILELTRAMAPEILEIRDEMATTQRMRELVNAVREQLSKRGMGDPYVFTTGTVPSSGGYMYGLGDTVPDFNVASAKQTDTVPGSLSPPSTNKPDARRPRRWGRKSGHQPQTPAEDKRKP